MGLFAIAVPLWLGCSYAWYRYTSYVAKKELAEQESYREESIKNDFLLKNVFGCVILFCLSVLMVLAWQVFVVIGFIAAVGIGFVAFLLRQWTKSVKADKKAS